MTRIEKWAQLRESIQTSSEYFSECVDAQVELEKYKKEVEELNFKNKILEAENNILEVQLKIYETTRN